MANRFLFIGGQGSSSGSTPETEGYSLRDTGPAGGYIFYINPNSATDGWTYLESAPVETEGTGSWTRGGDLSTTLNGNTLSTVGSGYDNTMSILNQVGYDGNSCSSYCVALTSGGESDWFLPSFGEVVLMRDNLQLYGFGDFNPTGSYWTSTENDATHAFRYKIGTGVYDGTHNKSSYYAYRAIRKF